MLKTSQKLERNVTPTLNQTILFSEGTTQKHREIRTLEAQH